MTGQSVGQERDERTYRGIGPHRPDPRAASVASQVAALIAAARAGTVVDHVGSTAVPGLIGKNVVDLQITAGPAEVPAITSALIRCGGGVFLLHCHVVPDTDADASQMIEFRDLLRRDPRAREAYASDKGRIAALMSDSLGYTRAKAALIHRLLGG